MADDEVEDIDETTQPQQDDPPEPEVEEAPKEEEVVEPEDEVPQLQLSMEVVGQNISLLARTGNGLSHAYTRLEIHGKGITDIDILESYPHLRYLVDLRRHCVTLTAPQDLSDNAIKDLEPLASLEYLLAIDFHSNRIKSIPASLDRRKYLQQANFAKNLISTIAVATWPMLAWLNLNGTFMTLDKPLSNGEENKLTELALQEFGELVHLEARQNRLQHTKGINAKKLVKLYLGGNAIQTLDLDEKPHLQILHLRDNRVNSLNGFSDANKALEYINLRYRSTLYEISKLSALPALKVLVLSENPIDQIPNYRIEILSRLPKLERIDKDPVTDEEREEMEQAKAVKAEA
ncbi:Leucine-rich repeat-containing protein 23 [Irineochytrium annulatum]|nr:Leucine-rich repeat-containing protein 23 [Irineochytrium annulatum]